jgi:hypothetical protein
MEPRALVVDDGTLTQTLYASFGGVWAYSRPAPQPGEAMTITMWTDPISGIVYANGQNFAGFEALVVDGYQNWVADDTHVPVTYSWAFDDWTGETIFDKYTADGQIAGGWSNVSSVGFVGFAARANVTATAFVSVVLLYNPPAGITVTAVPTTIATGGATTVVTATVPGLHEGIASDRTVVTFDTSLGTVVTSSVTWDGIATAILTSGNVAGTAVVVAATDGFSDTVAVEFVAGGYNVYLPLVLRNQ